MNLSSSLVCLASKGTSNGDRLISEKGSLFKVESVSTSQQCDGEKMYKLSSSGHSLLLCENDPDIKITFLVSSK